MKSTADEMRRRLERAIAAVEPPDDQIRLLAEARQGRLTKPPGSLGRLEELACRVAAMQRTLEPRLDSRRVVVYAGDHGVTAQGVSAYPSEVTAQMVANFAAGGAAINAIARAAGATLEVVDVGVAGSARVLASGIDGRAAGVELVDRNVAPGTRDMTLAPAMTEEETLAAILVGVETGPAPGGGTAAVALGEMGIGNTTAASAVIAALTGRRAAEVTGRGTGADERTYARKVAAVERALALHGSNLATPFDVLSRLGGLEIAAICGACIGAAARRQVVVVDGFISTAGAAIAAAIAPAARGYMVASHRSVEPGHAVVLAHLDLEPLLDLGMRLGEGTGAALALPIVDAAVTAFREMATFDSAGVSDRDR